MSPTLNAARLALKRHFGYDDFRRGQVDVVASVLARHDTLGVLPTGGGKSLCYQVPALVLPGLTVVISPLISLMKDQVDRLVSRGVPSAFLNSTLTSSETSRRLLAAERGILKLLYVAPERFESADLRRTLARCGISLLAVDEAHCISEWGHEFRPSFRRIAAVCATLGSPQIVALTATATPRVRQDIVRQLRMREPRTVVSGFDRPNLHYAVYRCDGDTSKDDALLARLRSSGHPSIVYAATRVTVERVARQLRDAGIRAVAYHGGLDDALRHEVQDAFMHEKVQTIVATNAFGMGIDKPNVRLVVHYSMPGTIEAYYQEAGRAGRDGLPARCVLLHARSDRRTHEWFIHGTFPEKDVIARVYAVMRSLRASGQPLGDTGALARVATCSSRDVAAATRFLLQHGLLVEQTGTSTVHVRLLATPARIHRELSGTAASPEIGVLRALWRLGVSSRHEGMMLDLDGLAPGLSGRVGRVALESLRDHQFVNFSCPTAGLYLTDASAPLESFSIDWEALSTRRASELAKLGLMEAYTQTAECRRRFVLGYFGERTIQRRCAGCDNCHLA